MNTTARRATLNAETSIVVPALNEARNLALLLPQLAATGHQVVVVDGGSLDDTVLVAANVPGVTVLVREQLTRTEAVAAAAEVATGPVFVLRADTTAAQAGRFVRHLALAA